MKNLFKHLVAWAALAMIIFGTHYAFSKEKCNTWDIQPPVLCEKSFFEAIKCGQAWIISRHEALQGCNDGTGVEWIWNGVLPHNDENAWISVNSYSKENFKLKLGCFILGNKKACSKIGEVITKIVDCWKRNNRKE